VLRNYETTWIGFFFKGAYYFIEKLHILTTKVCGFKTMVLLGISNYNIGD